MPNITISFNQRRQAGLLRSRAQGSDAGRWLLRALESAVNGTDQCDGLLWNANDDVSLGSTAHGGPAVGALVMATSSGTVGGSVCGTAITVTWATSDTASSTALAAAIRASTAINRRVTATNLSMRVTLATVTAGQFIDICNVRFTAVNGTPTDFGQFDMSGTDTADATALCLAINRHPALAMRWRAVSAAGLVYVFPTSDRSGSVTGAKFEAITNPGGFSTFTVNQAVLAAGPATAVLAIVPGDIGNECRLTASGTNVTAATNGTAGFLGHGTGGGVSQQFLLP